MNSLEMRLLIEKRARQILRISEGLLMETDSSDYEGGMAFRYAYLILRRPARYARMFGTSELSIDADAVNDFIWIHAGDIDGPRELSELEAATIRHHNEQCLTAETVGALLNQRLPIGAEY